MRMRSTNLRVKILIIVLIAEAELVEQRFLIFLLCFISLVVLSH